MYGTCKLKNLISSGPNEQEPIKKIPKKLSLLSLYLLKVSMAKKYYHLFLQSTACFLTNLFLSSNAVLNSFKILDLNGNNTSNGTRSGNIPKHCRADIRTR